MARKPRYTHEMVLELGQRNGYEMLDQVYKGYSSPHSYRCSEGHEWVARPSNIIYGFGCPDCWDKRRIGLQRYGIDVYKKVADERGGVCLSEDSDIKDTKSPLKFRCHEGHEWTTTGQSVLSGSWCKPCAVSQMSEKKATARLHSMEVAAAEKGGRCIGAAADGKYRYVFECSESHRWSAPYMKTKQGAWCGKCAKNAPLNLKTLQEAARSNGGLCLAETVPRAHEKVEWKCSIGHRWKATPSHILNGRTWCPTCGKKYRRESHCRVILEQMFGVSLPPERPDWLGVGPGGGKLELDGLNEDHGLAFEYNGIQHFEIDGFFIKDEAQLIQRQSIDKAKRDRCAERGIVLIDVDEFPKRAGIETMVRHVLAAVGQAGLPLPTEGIDFKSFDLSMAHRGARVDRFFDAVLLQNGTLIGQYIDDNTHVAIRCEEAHEWNALPKHVKNGHWCPACSGKRRGLASRKFVIGDLRMLAESRGGKCLSDAYEGTASSYLWKCHNDEHEAWPATLTNVSRGKWCPQCGRIKARENMRAKSAAKIGNRPLVKVTPIDAHREAFRLAGSEKVLGVISAKGGILIAGTYQNSRSSLLIKCENSHQFETMALSLMKASSSWCPFCIGRGKTIVDLMALAAQRGGTCTAEVYLGMDVPHGWQCGKGHRWEARPSNIQQGGWCPVCAQKKKKTIEEMQQMAFDKGGACLSTEYKGAFNQLEWECGQCKHTWFAMPTNVQRGKWCPPCARARAAAKRRKVKV